VIDAASMVCLRDPERVRNSGGTAISIAWDRARSTNLIASKLLLPAVSECTARAAKTTPSPLESVTEYRQRTVQSPPDITLGVDFERMFRQRQHSAEDPPTRLDRLLDLLQILDQRLS